MSRTRRVTVWVTGPIIMNLTKALANAREAERVSGRPLPRMRLSLCPMDRETGEGRVSARTAHTGPRTAPGLAPCARAAFPDLPSRSLSLSLGTPQRRGRVPGTQVELRWNSPRSGILCVGFPQGN